MKTYKPMLAKLGNFSDLEHLKFTYEEKLDGIHTIIYKYSSSLKVINRRNNNITPQIFRI